MKYERNKEKSTNEWYTPSYIIDALGGWKSFDLDPSAPMNQNKLNDTAQSYYTKEHDGLKQDWFGRVFLNPPYSNPEIKLFMEKMSLHGNGIALIYARTSSTWFHEYVLRKATSILFLEQRIKFLSPLGIPNNNPVAASVLISYGKEDAICLENCGLKGTHVYLNNL